MRSFMKRVIGIGCVLGLPIVSLADEAADIKAIRAEMAALRKSYESRISNLEQQLSKVAAGRASTGSDSLMASAPVATQPIESSVSALRGGKPAALSSAFNPAIGVILNGRYSSFDNGGSEFAGFAVGEEGERGREGLSLDESEIMASANADDKFAGSMTAALVREDGSDKVELEEAYVKTLPGAGLPTGLSVKAGRAFWTFGYLNEHHSHADDFADRPLPYRAFMNKAFNDDGVQVSYLLPTELYSEIGGGLFRGEDYPFGDGNSSGLTSWSGYARVGGDIGENQSWRLGGYLLAGDVGKRLANEDEVAFSGKTQLYSTDLRYTWAPTGNSKEQEVLLQSEYIWRNEDGTYEDTAAQTGAVDFDGTGTGFYVQSVYKFLPQWRVGARFSQLDAATVPAGLVGSALDAEGYNPKAYSAMIDWTNSEFSRIRLQFNHEELSQGETDSQVILQYVLSLGAHPAHAY